jgi:hypothetical protein
MCLQIIFKGHMELTAKVSVSSHNSQGVTINYDCKR